MIIIMASAVLAALSMAVTRYGKLEDPVMAWAAGVGGNWTRQAMIVLTKYGRLPFWSAVVIAIAALGRMAMAISIALSILTSIIIGRAVKEVVKRQRPYERMPLNAVTASGSSFPSNHCSVVWGASLLALSLLGPQLSLPLIAEAVLVSASRVLLLAHYPSDCVGGLLIGVISWRIGLIMYRAVLGLPLPL
ncbi:phosphatase PAP2 family protein [Thermocladium modestius]|uniref:Phosphatase PAP2 family protein n=1 Tax=Thermocladium modestius TaxID=62609 RepID=A0A830GTZ1_9CREN|nr:phosphatase PAP2 family protein [Thermocladium modestius]GGP19431.1 phosphatase PAP2 family protein [Thermocladium modestius]